LLEARLADEEGALDPPIGEVRERDDAGGLLDRRQGGIS
jgi:hypothetical protein